MRWSVTGREGVKADRRLIRTLANGSANLGSSWSSAVALNRGSERLAAFLETRPSRAGGATTGETTEPWLTGVDFRLIECGRNVSIQLTRASRFLGELRSRTFERLR